MPCTRLSFGCWFNCTKCNPFYDHALMAIQVYSGPQLRPEGRLRIFIYELPHELVQVGFRVLACWMCTSPLAEFGRGASCQT